MWIKSYGRLYQRLCSTTCEIPLGIYRTQLTSTIDLNIGTGIAISFDFMLPLTEQLNYQALHSELERVEITNLVRNRLADMGIPCSDYGKMKFNFIHKISITFNVYKHRPFL